jgi:hypothetical protein
MPDNQPIAIAYPDTTFNCISLERMFSSYVVHDLWVVGIPRPGYKAALLRTRKGISKEAVM